MTPAMMAQYWQRMQQYFQQMQQNLAQQQAGGGGMPGAMGPMGGMNPMQMQQMQARQYGAIPPPNGIPLDSEDEDFSPNSFKSMTTVPEDLMWLLPPTLAGFDFGTKVCVC